MRERVRWREREGNGGEWGKRCIELNQPCS